MTKVELFDSKLQETAALFKSLSHPARLAILKYLAESKICMSGDISEELPLSRTTVNQHLSELKKMDLIKGEIDGVKTNYCINQEKIEIVNKQLSGFLKYIDCCHGNNDNC
jgi:ArsR family transcriptional regulator